MGSGIRGTESVDDETRRYQCPSALLSPPRSILKFSTQEESLLTFYSNNTNNKASNLRNVRFGTMTIHNHETILGDHPCVSSGLPVALGWKCVDHVSLPVLDNHNASRLPCDWLLSPSKRHLRLRSAGLRLSFLMNQTVERQRLRGEVQRERRPIAHV